MSKARVPIGCPVKLQRYRAFFAPLTGGEKIRVRYRGRTYTGTIRRIDYSAYVLVETADHWKGFVTCRFDWIDEAELVENEILECPICGEAAFSPDKNGVCNACRLEEDF